MAGRVNFLCYPYFFYSKINMYNHRLLSRGNTTMRVISSSVSSVYYVWCYRNEVMLKIMVALSFVIESSLFLLRRISIIYSVWRTQVLLSLANVTHIPPTMHGRTLLHPCFCPLELRHVDGDEEPAWAWPVGLVVWFWSMAPAWVACLSVTRPVVARLRA